MNGWRSAGILVVLLASVLLMGGLSGLPEDSLETTEFEEAETSIGSGEPFRDDLQSVTVQGTGRVEGRMNFAVPGMPWPEHPARCSEMSFDPYWVAMESAFGLLPDVDEVSSHSAVGASAGGSNADAVSGASGSFRREPNDTCRPAQFHLDMIDAPRAWAVQTGDRSVVVAVVDTGIDPTHPDLRDNLVPGFDLVSEECPSILNRTIHEDCMGHGTAIAGIIGAVGDNGIGITGVAWSVSLMPVRVKRLLDATPEMAAAGIRLAAEAGADVINLSGGGLNNHPIVEEAVADAIARGAVVVASVGNDSARPPGYPAALEGVIGVGALEFASEPKSADFSAIGPGVDLVAPGEFILYTTLGADYARGSGTSAAAPIVSGVAALMIANGIPHHEVAEVLFRTAIWIGDPINNVSDRERHGHGLVNAYAAVMGVDPKETRLQLFTVEGVPVGNAVSPNEQRQYALDGVPAGEELYLLAWIDVDRDGFLNQGDYVALKRIVLEDGETLTVDVDVAVLDASISLDVDGSRFDLAALIEALPSRI